MRDRKMEDSKKMEFQNLLIQAPTIRNLLKKIEKIIIWQHQIKIIMEWREATAEVELKLLLKIN